MQGDTSRVALYWTPHRDDPLWLAGTLWLGRDAELGTTVLQPALPGMADFTSSPRWYGFHATLRPPIRLATGWDEFMIAAHGIAARHAAFVLPKLSVTRVGGFLALCMDDPCPALQRLANDCVQATDRHRLRPEPAEVEKRRGVGLSAAEDAQLLRWGYPYVMACWRFHLTLSRHLSDAEMNVLLPEAERHFAPALSTPRRVTDISVCTQAAFGASLQPFLIGDRLRLRG